MTHIATRWNASFEGCYLIVFASGFQNYIQFLRDSTRFLTITNQIKKVNDDKDDNKEDNEDNEEDECNSNNQIIKCLTFSESQALAEFNGDEEEADDDDEYKKVKDDNYDNKEDKEDNKEDEENNNNQIIKSLTFSESQAQAELNGDDDDDDNVEDKKVKDDNEEDQKDNNEMGVWNHPHPPLGGTLP